MQHENITTLILYAKRAINVFDLVSNLPIENEYANRSPGATLASKRLIGNYTP